MRNWHIAKSLASIRSLTDIIGEMTEEEVLRALEIEAGSRRRSVLIDKLIQKAAELHRHTYLQKLKEKYRGKN